MNIGWRVDVSELWNEHGVQILDVVQIVQVMVPEPDRITPNRAKTVVCRDKDFGVWRKPAYDGLHLSIEDAFDLLLVDKRQRSSGNVTAVRQLLPGDAVQFLVA